MSISDKLTYLNETKQKIKESINLTDANITNEPFRQYAVILKNRLPEIVGDPSIIWNNYEHVTGSGTSFSINAYNSIFNYSMLGDTVQNGTPTPDAPIPVNVVSGDNTIDICGKNLLDIDNWVKGRINNTTGNIEFASNVSSMVIGENNISFVVSQAWNSGITSDFIPISTGNYVFKYSHNREMTMCIDTYDNQKTRIARIDAFTQTQTPTIRTFTISDSNAKYIRIHFEVNTANVEYIVSEMQLEKGSTATTYEPYIGNTYPLSLGNIELCKIGTYQDYIYKDNGSWYLHKEIGKVVLDGSETWVKHGSIASWFYYDGITNGYVLDNTQVLIKTNYYTPKAYQGVPNLVNGECAYGSNDSGVTHRFVIKNTDYTQTNDFKNWLSTHNTIVYYALATPTNTEITDSHLLLQLDNLKLVNGLNNIITVGSDLNPIIDIEAIKYLD